MAFGDFVQSDSGSATSVTNPMAVSAGFYVPGGDLVVVAVAENTSLTAGTCTDVGVGGNVFTPFNVGLDAGSVSLRGYWCIVTVPGIVKASCAFTASADDACILQCQFKGPFSPAPQIDGNPAVLSDASTPFTSNLTGTLAQANELVVSSFAMALAATTLTGSAPNVARAQKLSAAQGTAGSCCVGIGSWVVAVNTSISASWTASATPTGGAVHIATFKQDPATNVPGPQAIL